MNKVYLTIICSFLFHAVFSQADEIEKLKKVLQSGVHDTLKLTALSDLNWLYSEKDPELSEKYGREELRIARKIAHKKWESQAYNDIGISKYKAGHLDSSLHYYNLSLEIRKQLKEKELIVAVLSKMGVVYRELGNYKQALKVQFEALRILETIDNSRYLAMTYNNIGIIYEKLKNDDKVISYMKKAVDIHLRNKEDYFIAHCYGNLANAYKRKGDLNKSTEYLQEAMEIFTRYDDKYNLAGVYNSMGMNLREVNKNKEALSYYQKAYNTAKEVDDKLGLGLYGHNISCVLTDMGRYKEAEKYELTALQETEKGNNAQLLLCYRQLAVIYGYLKDGSKVDLYVDKYANLKDSIFNTASASQIAELEVRFQSEKTQRELAEERERVAQKEKINSENQLKLESRRKWLLVAIALSIGLLGVSIWIYRFQKARRKNEKREYELNKQLETVVLEKGFAEEKIRIARELHDNIGSHLTFMISSLDNMAYEKNPEAKLEKIGELSNFGRVTMKDLRDTIWAMNHDGGTVEQLLTRISELRAVLPGSLSVEIDNTINPDRILNGLQLLNCFRIVQEFIQNAVKYAQAGKISINLSGAEEGFVLKIADNGKGFDVSKISFGNGILNMRRRCEDLGGEFELRSSGGGTEVICRIPWDFGTNYHENSGE